MVLTHYSLKAKVVIGGKTGLGDGFLALAKFQTPAGAIRLSAPETTVQYLFQLYEALRLADRKRLKKLLFYRRVEANLLLQ